MVCCWRSVCVWCTACFYGRACGGYGCCDELCVCVKIIPSTAASKPKQHASSAPQAENISQDVRRAGTRENISTTNAPLNGHVIRNNWNTPTSPSLSIYLFFFIFPPLFLSLYLILSLLRVPLIHAATSSASHDATGLYKLASWVSSIAA